MRPASNYRAARRNRWRAIPRKDRPAWTNFKLPPSRKQTEKRRRV